ncbi:MAG: 16S rRNA (cytosine(1402)-N(4))-methyltransferase, partial [Rhodospirillales bacterium]|nr:16S rRNA (cytosine(1402)-N(4))-methyltransferase [Rhodospirillales bacterium]
IYEFGEERHARHIAKAIIEARSQEPFSTVGQLAGIARRIVGRSSDGLDPATRTFLALRIRVNDELGELRRGLRAAEQLLAPGGRLVVVSFHSLEDRAVKEFMRARSGRTGAGVSRHRPEIPGKSPAPSFHLIRRGVQRPGDQETKANPRARSARLRTAERTDAPHWPTGQAA